MHRNAVRKLTLASEAELVQKLADDTGLPEDERAAICAEAADLIKAVRDAGDLQIMETFLTEYGLSTKEGVALMCLAEAMLRVPDTMTIDELIKDKITPHDWSSHFGQAGSILVNASTWGLMLTGRVLDEDTSGIAGTLHGLVRRMGEPVIRTAVGTAMAEMGSQFVLGRNIDEAMKRGDGMVQKGYSYSYDMLGEAAKTETHARQYHQAYKDAIKAISFQARHEDIRDNPGISVKLSALHPRYEQSQKENMLPLLASRLLELAMMAKEGRIGLNIDAEEADRLDLSLDVIETVLADPGLAGWDGFGIVVQAYGKRAGPVLDFLYELAQKLDRKIMIRLVKGAYWDMEIKRAQVLGLDGYPVFTRKSHTDISYLACAKKLLSMADRIYPQFATHNAHTLAAILHMAGDKKDQFEFQRLHGMGESLHNIVMERGRTRCRIYAPVGAHEDLLAYLVRRLLENGANSSFVNQIVDLSVKPEEIAKDPIQIAKVHGFSPNPAIPMPCDLFAPRRNSKGWDLTDPVDLEMIEQGRMLFQSPHQWHASPITPLQTGGMAKDLHNPARPEDRTGSVIETGHDLISQAVEAGCGAQPAWEALGSFERAKILNNVADLYEENSFEILALASREAGKNLLDGVAEIREAVDFLRYYADQAQEAGPRKARGVIVCISPWNFPLAIFTGQIAAALAAGNAVIAKPAEQTPLIAFRAVELMLKAGVPPGVIQLLPGDGVKVGAPLVADLRIAGVCFTGSTAVAQLIHKQLTQNPNEPMLIAETGGMNAMMVDSTALLEQATRDIVRAAFQSAGQRCSALRVLYVQKDVAANLLSMLEGAMDSLYIGEGWDLRSDVGPVIDREAYGKIMGYIVSCEKEGRLVKKLAVPDEGFFVPPSIIRVTGIEEMEDEIFGPILHLAEFEASQIDQVMKAVNGKGYGLTFGLHTRIDRRVQRIIDLIKVGNVYVNRDQIGAIVGSQPFGGQGLSGTGPKAGGPHYLERFFLPAENKEGHAGVGAPSINAGSAMTALNELDPENWALATDRIATLRLCLRGRAAQVIAASSALDMGPIDLPGPTGESNQFFLRPRGVVLCLGPSAETLLAQSIQALAAGNGVLAIAPDASKALKMLKKEKRLPLAILDGSFDPVLLKDLAFDAAAYSGPVQTRHAMREALAARNGAILPLITEAIAPASYCHEMAVCIDTTAAGGNTSLLTEAAF